VARQIANGDRCKSPSKSLSFRTDDAAIETGDLSKRCRLSGKLELGAIAVQAHLATVSSRDPSPQQGAKWLLLVVNKIDHT
jgi:hypothetical protein